MQIKLINQIVLPARGQGIDWGSPLLVIAQSGKRELAWHKGHTGWAGRGSRAYYPAELLYFPDTSRSRMDHRILHDNEKLESGYRKLSSSLLREAVPDSLFGVSLADHWKRGKTIIISASNPEER